MIITKNLYQEDRRYTNNLHDVNQGIFTNIDSKQEKLIAELKTSATVTCNNDKNGILKDCQCIEMIKYLLEENKNLREVKERFHRNIVHNHRVPFGNIKNLQEIIYERLVQLMQEDRELNSLFRFLFKETNKLFKYIEQVTAVSDYISNKRLYVVGVINFRDIINNSCKKIAKKYRFDARNLIYNNIPDDLAVQGNFDRLQSAMDALLESAWYGINEDEKQHTTAIGLWVDNNKVMMRVGAGYFINQDELDKIFHAGEVASIQRSKAGDMGYGLSYARIVFREHGGEVWAENIDKNQTLFYIKIPLNLLNN